MRKNVFGRQLGRTKNQRQALFRGLLGSLVAEGEVETTLAKAKAFKPQAEKLITKARTGTLADRRIIFQALNKRNLANRLVEEIGPLFKGRPGGYLKIVRIGRRRGDLSETARVMFIEKVDKMSERPAVKVSPPAETATPEVVEEKKAKKTKVSKKEAIK